MPKSAIRNPKSALTIAGSDPIGGAGIQADLKTFAAHNVHCFSVITALTAQNTLGVQGVYNIPFEFVHRQLISIIEDIKPINIHSMKTGMLANAEIVEIVAGVIKEYNLTNIIIDPIIKSSSGAYLLNPQAIDTLKNKLLPLATLITPNLDEAKVLLGNIDKLDKLTIAKKLAECFNTAILLKGGHFIGKNGKSEDILYDGKEISIYSAERINTNCTHGTGCTLSASITANLALGYKLKEAIKHAKNYLTGAMKNAKPITEKGKSPLAHFWNCGM